MQRLVLDLVLVDLAMGAMEVLVVLAMAMVMVMVMVLAMEDYTAVVFMEVSGKHVNNCQ